MRVRGIGDQRRIRDLRRIGGLRRIGDLCLFPVLVVLAFVMSACGNGERVLTQRSSLDEEQVRAEVETFLEGWVQAFEARDMEAIRSILVDDARFTWFEDGEPRYASPDAIIMGLSSFPLEQGFSHTLSQIRVRSRGQRGAAADMLTHTEITMGGAVVVSFDGAVTMELERGSEGWRIVVAHTSTRRPQQAATTGPP